MARVATAEVPRVTPSNSGIPEQVQVDFKEFVQSEAYPFLMSELKRLHSGRQRMAFDQPMSTETSYLRYYNIGMSVGVDMVVSFIQRLAEEGKET
jgi:hypothetical protein